MHMYMYKCEHISGNGYTTVVTTGLTFPVVYLRASNISPPQFHKQAWQRTFITLDLVQLEHIVCNYTPTAVRAITSLCRELRTIYTAQ